MKAISVMQPWAWGIVDGGKPFENRTWPQLRKGFDGIARRVARGERVAIHASQKVDVGGWPTCVRLAGDAAARLRQPSEIRARSLAITGDTMAPTLRTSAVIGTAALVDVARSRAEAVELLGEDAARWFFGPYALVFADPRPLRRPVPCGGALYLWTLPEHVARAVLASEG